MEHQIVENKEHDKPNIIYIYADDLGRGMLSFCGQKHFKTPSIDRLAHEGMFFTQAYGCTLCAPARASFLCGIHDAHPGRWTFNTGGSVMDAEKGESSLEEMLEILNNTGIDRDSDGVYLPSLASGAGYYTAQIGKLEWGFTTNPEEIKRHGWDYHFGYYDHERCHGFYPPYLFENGQIIPYEGNTRLDCGRGQYSFKGPEQDDRSMEGREVYSQDIFDLKIEEIIRENKDQPFFLYHPSQLPHGPVFYPDIYEELADNEELSQVEKEYASMVIRLDRTVGKILDLLDELNLTDKTMVVFSSDNGHGIPYIQAGRMQVNQTLSGESINDITNCVRSESCGDVFNGNDGMAGMKTTSWEGGVRIPYIVRWPGQVKAGTSCDSMIANYDFMATMTDMLSLEIPKGKDGVSFLPLLKEEEQEGRDYIVFGSPTGPSLVTSDGWKLRSYINKNKSLDYVCYGDYPSALKEAVLFQLFNQNEDYEERKDLSAKHPEVVKTLRINLLRECGGNLIHGLTQSHFAFAGYAW